MLRENTCEIYKRHPSVVALLPSAIQKNQQVHRMSRFDTPREVHALPPFALIPALLGIEYIRIRVLVEQTDISDRRWSLVFLTVTLSRYGVRTPTVFAPRHTCVPVRFLPFRGLVLLIGVPCVVMIFYSRPQSTVERLEKREFYNAYYRFFVVHLHTNASLLPLPSPSDKRNREQRPHLSNEGSGKFSSHSPSRESPTRQAPKDCLATLREGCAERILRCRCTIHLSPVNKYIYLHT